MNTIQLHHLKKQREFYGAFGDELEVNPISKIDTQIISELVELLKKVQLTQAVSIMNDYKRIPDNLIAESLMELNTSISVSEGSNSGYEEEDNKQKTIFFNNLFQSRYKLYDIFSYSVVNDEQYPSILLNETPKDSKKVPVVSNVLLQYRNETERDADLLILDNLF
jgi:hypothetical protein